MSRLILAALIALFLAGCDGLGAAGAAHSEAQQATEAQASEQRALRGVEAAQEQAAAQRREAETQ